MKISLALAAILILYSCNTNSTFVPGVGTTGFVPIYADTANLRPIALEASRPTIDAGKIYVYGRYIFQNEQNEGIHIIDNSDPAHPEKKAFLYIPYNTDMAIRAGHLYANSINDMLVIDLTNPLQPQLEHRIEAAFPIVEQSFPSEQGYFVCPDPSKGVVVGWKLQDNVEAKCRR